MGLEHVAGRGLMALILWPCWFAALVCEEELIGLDVCIGAASNCCSYGLDWTGVGLGWESRIGRGSGRRDFWCLFLFLLFFTLVSSSDECEEALLVSVLETSSSVIELS